MDAGAPGPRDMAPTRPGLPLPMELVLKIINYLHDNETRGSCRPARDKKLENSATGLVDDEFDDWLYVGNRFETVTEQAKINIASVRLKFTNPLLC